jgi:hypothetical protein
MNSVSFLLRCQWNMPGGSQSEIVAQQLIKVSKNGCELNF